jgi:hypothetical protein
MLSRRTALVTLASLVGLGCTKPPALPPATSFLKDIQLLDRDGKALPSEWVVSQSQPIDPTIRFLAIEPPAVLAGRKVLPADQWMIVVDVRDESDQSRWGDRFRTAKTFGEETVGDQDGPLVWESPDVPKSLPKGAIWQWCHCRIPEPGRFTLVFKLYPTPFQMPGSPNIDYGEGIELARQTVVVEPGEKPNGSLMMAVISTVASDRTGRRRLWAKKK